MSVGIGKGSWLPLPAVRAGQKELKGFAFQKIRRPHSGFMRSKRRSLSFPLPRAAVRPVSASQNTMELGFQPISAQDKGIERLRLSKNPPSAR